MTTSEVLTYVIVEALVPRFAIRLVPIDHPKTVDVRGPLHILTPLRSPDSDALDLDRHVHAGINVSPVWRNVAQDPPVLAFPVGKTLPPGPDALPECALRNIFFVASLLPPFPLFPKRQSLFLQVVRLLLQSILLYTHLSHGVDVFVNLGGEKVDGDKNHGDKQDEGPTRAPVAVDFLSEEMMKFDPVGNDKRDLPQAYALLRRGLELANTVEGIVGQTGEEELD